MIRSVATATMSLEIFSIICLFIFSLFQLQVLHCVGVSTFYSKYVHTYNLVFRQLLYTPEIQSLSLDLRYTFYFFIISIYSVFISGSQFQLHSILSNILCWNIECYTKNSHISYCFISYCFVQISQKVTYLFCDQLNIDSKVLMGRVRQATRDVVKSEV